MYYPKIGELKSLDGDNYDLSDEITGCQMDSYIDDDGEEKDMMIIWYESEWIK